MNLLVESTKLTDYKKVVYCSYSKPETGENRCAVKCWISVCYTPFTQSCDLCAACERPEKWLERSVVAQTHKFLFLCNYYSTTPVPSLNDLNAAVVAQKVAQGRQNSTLPRWLKGCRGRRMEAQWSPQWSLNRRYWSAKGDTMVVQGRQKRRSNWYPMFTPVRIFYGATNDRPLCIHYDSATTTMCLPSPCLLWATCERPTSLATFVRLFEHAQIFTATMASMAMTKRPVYQPWTTKAIVRPPLCHQRRPGQFCGRKREAQRSQPLCKGGIIRWKHMDKKHNFNRYRVV